MGFATSSDMRPIWPLYPCYRLSFPGIHPIREDVPMSVLDDYLVHPGLSLLDKTKIQAQVLVPLLQALRAELGKERADAIVRQALRDWSTQLFATVGNGVEGSP